MTYAGFDVFEVHPNRMLEEDTELTQSVTLLDSKTGAVDIELRGDTPIYARPFLWTLMDRTAIDEALAFLDARKGRAIPFWAPTWQADLELAQPLSSGSTSRVIRHAGYTEEMFPHNARRHLALIEHTGAIHPRAVTAAVENVVDGTETLTLSSGTPNGLRLAPSLVSFLQLYRLDDDRQTIEWDHAELASLEMRFRELPREVPAP